jgi:hypothetical protein
MAWTNFRVADDTPGTAGRHIRVGTVYRQSGLLRKMATNSVHHATFSLIPATQPRWKTMSAPGVGLCGDTT